MVRVGEISGLFSHGNRRFHFGLCPFSGGGVGLVSAAGVPFGGADD